MEPRAGTEQKVQNKAVRSPPQETVIDELSISTYVVELNETKVKALAILKEALKGYVKVKGKD